MKKCDLCDSLADGESIKELCKAHEKEVLDEYYEKQEELMQETYESIIRSSY